MTKPDRNSWMVLPLPESAQIGVQIEAFVHEVCDLVAAQDMVLRDPADGVAFGEFLGEHGVDPGGRSPASSRGEPHAQVNVALERDRFVMPGRRSVAHADANDVEPRGSKSAFYGFANVLASFTAVGFERRRQQRVRREPGRGMQRATVDLVLGD